MAPDATPDQGDEALVEAVVPARHVVAFPLSNVRPIRREGWLPGSGAWSIRIDPLYQHFLVGLLLQSNASVGYACLNYVNGQVLEQWRILPASPDLPIFLPMRSVDLGGHSYDWAELQLAETRTEAERVDVDLSGLWVPYGQHATAF